MGRCCSLLWVRTLLFTTTFIIESLEITSGVHSDKDESDEYCAGDREATSYIYRISNFGLIVGITTL